jgi:hypothetical protein
VRFDCRAFSLNKQNIAEAQTDIAQFVDKCFAVPVDSENGQIVILAEINRLQSLSGERRIAHHHHFKKLDVAACKT